MNNNSELALHYSTTGFRLSHGNSIQYRGGDLGSIFVKFLVEVGAVVLGVEVVLVKNVQISFRREFDKDFLFHEVHTIDGERDHKKIIKNTAVRYFAVFENISQFLKNIFFCF